METALPSFIVPEKETSDTLRSALVVIISRFLIIICPSVSELSLIVVSTSSLLLSWA